jgi:hypothetical protein
MDLRSLELEAEFFRFRFPGSLVLKRGELEKISGNDINVYFQIAIEMFDYLDEIVGKYR